MKLSNTELLMNSYIRKKYCDSYAVLVCRNSEKSLITSENVNEDTYFDIASCGKVMVTSTLILIAIGEGKLSLEDTLDQFFARVPEEKKKITVKQLLTHTSGIIRYEISRETAKEGHDAAAEFILNKPLAYQPGSDYIYSCNGFILLGFILEKIYGKPLTEIFRLKIKEPLGMTRAAFVMPEDEKNRAICHRRDADGEFPADDEITFNMKECVGNGAQFYTISDASKLMDAILEKSKILYPEKLFDLAEKDYTPDFSLGRGLGYWITDDRTPEMKSLFSEGSFGHHGSTGTNFVIDRKNNQYVILFSNFRRGFERGMKMEYWSYMDRFAELRGEIYSAIARDIKADTEG